MLVVGDFEDSVGMMGAFGSGGKLMIAPYVDYILPKLVCSMEVSLLFDTSPW